MGWCNLDNSNNSIEPKHATNQPKSIVFDTIVNLPSLLLEMGTFRTQTIYGLGKEFLILEKQATVIRLDFLLKSTE